MYNNNLGSILILYTFSLYIWMIFSRWTLTPPDDAAGDDVFSTSPVDFVLRFTTAIGTGNGLEGLADEGDAELEDLR